MAVLSIYGEDVVQDIKTNLCLMQGKIYAKNNVSIMNTAFRLSSVSGKYTRCVTDRYGRYGVYLTPGQAYGLYFWSGTYPDKSRAVGVVQAEETGNKDITLDVIEMTGKLLDAEGKAAPTVNLTIRDSQGHRVCRQTNTDEEGNYKVYLREGIYKITQNIRYSTTQWHAATR